MDKQNQDIKTVSEQSRIKPPSTAWDKLEGKLDADLKLAQVKKSRMMSSLMNVAATFLILVVCFFVYKETQQDFEVSKGNIAEWEELTSPTDLSDDYYDLSRVHALTEAYKS